jgi:hypothetical protein
MRTNSITTRPHCGGDKGTEKLCDTEDVGWTPACSTSADPDRIAGDPATAIDLPYKDRQQSHDKKYLQAFPAWIESMSPEELQLAKELGLDCPYIPGAGSGNPGRDPADSPLATCSAPRPDEPDESDEPDEPDIEWEQDLIRLVVGVLIGHDNPRLAIECLALIIGLAYPDNSISDIALRHEVTEAAILEKCGELMRALDLDPSPAMRSLTPLQRSTPVDPDAPDEHETEADRTHRLLRRLIGELIAHNNTQLTLDCFALATGIAYQGESMIKIAQRHGVTRAAISKRCVALTRTFNLQPSGAMRSLKARLKYRVSRLKSLRAKS